VCGQGVGQTVCRPVGAICPICGEDTCYSVMSVLCVLVVGGGGWSVSPIWGIVDIGGCCGHKGRGRCLCPLCPLCWLCPVCLVCPFTR